MYTYHALINTLIHINLNTIFYTQTEHSPTKTIYILYIMEKQAHTRVHTHKNTHNDCSTNWVLVLAGVEIL